MKKVLVIVLLFNCSIVIGQNALNIVPMPVEVKMGKGYFTLDKTTTLYYTGNAVKDMCVQLNSVLQEKYGFVLSVKPFTVAEAKSQNAKNKSINFFLVNKEITEIGDWPSYTYMPGFYGIRSEKNYIDILSRSEQGLFYALQTFFQLLPVQKDAVVQKNYSLSIPQLSITDYPRFPYRGMHLDVCRHFFPVSFIKKYIDYLATYKYNKFHWHLTEDQGWRIEIKKYPELTTTGALRNGTLIGRYPGKGNDNKPYGGFYTQEQIKEVVQYAKDRYIEVIPEIEMPGHGSAAIAAYPWLSCFPEKPTAIPAKMISQKSIEEQKNGRIKLVQETWGVFDDIFCAGKESTFTFLENVIDEVVTLFPSKYFHMGGDEAPKAHWKKCPACQKRMKDNKLKDEHELQSWFVRRIEKYVNSKGKILIGWDEILEGGLAPNAVVMSWRGEKGGIEAAKQKHNVIMTPGNPLYFDHTQSKNEDSVTFGGYNPIENVYAYEPMSKELSAEEGKYVLGAQANMWTEYQNNTRKLEYQMFPRMMALSEVLWSPKEKRDWKDFERRLPAIYYRLDKKKINYSKAYYDLKATVMPTEDYTGVLWNLESKINCEYKDIRFVEYLKEEGEKRIIIPKYDSLGYVIDSTIIIEKGKVLSGRSKNPIKIITDDSVVAMLVCHHHSFSEVSQKFSFNKATGKKITLVIPADKKYPADGPFTLVNGVRNEKGMLKSSEFLGFNGTDMEAIIDLGSQTTFKTVIVNSLSQNGSWIYQPKNCLFLTSDDGINFKEVPGIISEMETINNRKTTMSKQDGSSISARYIKVIAKNYGIIPAGNPGAGTPAWLFVDEIEVQ